MGGPAQYEIRVAGVLDGRWAAWFGGLQISGQGEETQCHLEERARCRRRSGDSGLGASFFGHGL
jgi:hypothetical protein